MMSVAYGMSREEREAVAHYLGHGEDDTTLPASAVCKADQRVMSSSPRRQLGELESRTRQHPIRRRAASRASPARTWPSSS